MIDKKMHFSVAKIKREIFVLNSLINRLDNAILSRCDISVQQAKIICLLVISTHDEIYQKDVDYFLGVTHATSHGLIKRMEEKIKSDPHLLKKLKNASLKGSTEINIEPNDYLSSPLSPTRETKKEE